MRYRIYSKGHEGVVSWDEETYGIIEGDSPNDAALKFKNSNIHPICSKIEYNKGWDCYIVGWWPVSVEEIK